MHVGVCTHERVCTHEHVCTGMYESSILTFPLILYKNFLEKPQLKKEEKNLNFFLKIKEEREAVAGDGTGLQCAMDRWPEKDFWRKGKCPPHPQPPVCGQAFLYH